VRDREGKVLLEGGNKCKRAVEQGVARRATALLQGPIVDGTASRNGQIGRPAAGKTGTTSEYRDAWFTGYIPQLSAAAWVGYEQPAALYDGRCPDGRVTGGCLPTMIWQRFMRGAVSALMLPVEQFAEPPPLPTALIPDVIGKPVEEAKALLREVGFYPDVRTVSSYQPTETVIASDPTAGVQTELGGPVRLVVSDGTGQPPASSEPSQDSSSVPEFSPFPEFFFPDEPNPGDQRNGYDPYNPYGGYDPFGDGTQP
jgi:membrane peptidoglycan carboxypeptidase